MTAREYNVAVIYVGHAADLTDRERPAGDVVSEIGEGTETMLREIERALLMSSDEHE